MQYSQYCRGPAAKAGRAEHEISGRSRKATSWMRRLSLLVCRQINTVLPAKKKRREIPAVSS